MTSKSISHVLLLLFLFGGILQAERTSITWNTHYGSAKRVAQATKRPLLVVIENTGTVPNQIEAELDDSSKKKILKQDFELVRVDANTDYGKRVAKAFGARSFPYTAVTDGASERIVFRKAGPMSQTDWTVALAKSAKAPPATPVKVVQSQQLIGQPIIVNPQPAVVIHSQPIIQSQPSISTDFFTPNGVFQLPASQCFT